MKNIVILISGRGSNFEAILEASRAEQWESAVPARIAAVISNRPLAKGLETARREGIDAIAVDHTLYPDRESFEEELGRVVDRYNPDLIVLAGFIVCSFGLQKGLERISKWMMICLLALIVILAINSLTLDGAMEGVKFYLVPDFERAAEVGIGNVIVAAMNQSFFTLSLGIAAMEIFGSYMSDANRLPGEAVRICCLDTFVALMSGMIIFPACFSFGLEPGQGPSLIFMTLPRVFVSMTGGRLWGALFFLFLTFASFTTVLAVFENIMASCMDNFGWSRKKATIVCGIFILLASMPCVLGYNLWYFEASLPSGATGQILDIEDFLVSNLLLPIGSLIYLLFCVSKWGWGFDKYLAEANKGTGLGMSPRFKIYFQFILPMLILVILLVGLGSWGWRALICAAVAVFVWFMARRSSSKSTI